MLFLKSSFSCEWRGLYTFWGTNIILSGYFHFCFKRGPEVFFSLVWKVFILKFVWIQIYVKTICHSEVCSFQSIHPVQPYSTNLNTKFLWGIIVLSSTLEGWKVWKKKKKKTEGGERFPLGGLRRKVLFLKASMTRTCSITIHPFLGKTSGKWLPQDPQQQGSQAGIRLLCFAQKIKAFFVSELSLLDTD